MTTCLVVVGAPPFRAGGEVKISSYTTQSGVRYRVRYRKPDGSQTDKRGFKRKRDAEQWAAEHVTTAKAQGSFIDPQDTKDSPQFPSISI